MRRTLPKPPQIVDLHADAFLDNWEDYDNNELLTESITRLRETLDAAIYWEYQEIRYIHGKGKGILREAIYEELGYYKENGLIVRYYPSHQNQDIVVVVVGF